jgi:hypothetical protein
MLPAKKAQTMAIKAASNCREIPAIAPTKMYPAPPAVVEDGVMLPQGIVHDEKVQGSGSL